jgi:hypothetical protein
MQQRINSAVLAEQAGIVARGDNRNIAGFRHVVRAGRRSFLSNATPKPTASSTSGGMWAKSC